MEGRVRQGKKKEGKEGEGESEGGKWGTRVGFQKVVKGYETQIRLLALNYPVSSEMHWLLLSCPKDCLIFPSSGNWAETEFSIRCLSGTIILVISQCISQWSLPLFFKVVVNGEVTFEVRVGKNLYEPYYPEANRLQMAGKEHGLEPLISL